MAVTSPRPGGYAQALASDDPLVNFMYTLLRDHLPAGVVEGIVCEREQRDVRTVQYSNDWLAAYAYELACRLRGTAPVDALASAHRVVRRAQGQGGG